MPAAGQATEGGAADSVGEEGGQSGQGGAAVGDGGGGAPDTDPACDADLLTDAEHCGSCERACAADASCHHGHCLEALVELWYPHGLTTDADYVYAIGHHEQLRQVHRIDAASGEAELIVADDNPATTYGLAVNDQYLFTNTAGTAYRAPKAGGSFAEVGSLTEGTGSSSVAAIAASDDHVYWTGLRGIFRAPAAGGAVEYWVKSCAAELWVDGDTLYWHCDHGASIGRRPLSSGPAIDAPIDSIPIDGSAENFALDDQYVYWLDWFNAGPDFVGVVPKAGGETTTFTGLGELGQSIALDDAHLYIAGQGRLLRLPKSGGAPDVHAELPDGFLRLLVNGDYVYFTSGTTVYRITID
jgi:hypothetical protein